jgi:hypothetical protein
MIYFARLWTIRPSKNQVFSWCNGEGWVDYCSYTEGEKVLIASSRGIWGVSFSSVLFKTCSYEQMEG